MTLINKIALSILVTKRIYTNSEWNLWADNWLSGKDRGGVTAATASATAYAAATVYATAAYDAATAYAAIADATAAYYAAIAAATAYDASAITTIAAAYASKSLYFALQTSIELNITIDIQAEFKTALTIK